MESELRVKGSGSAVGCLFFWGVFYKNKKFSYKISCSLKLQPYLISFYRK